MESGRRKKDEWENNSLKNSIQGYSGSSLEAEQNWPGMINLTASEDGSDRSK